MDKLINRVKLMVERGERISGDDCKALFGVKNLLALAAIARIPRERRFGRQTFCLQGPSGELKERDGIVTLRYGAEDNPEEFVAALEQVRTAQDADASVRCALPIAVHTTGVEPYLSAPTAAQTLRITAITRIALDNVPHIAVAPTLVSDEVACVALDYGADTVDPTITGIITVPSPDTATVNPFVTLTIAELSGDEGVADEGDTITQRIGEARWKVVMVDSVFGEIAKQVI